jgi:NAD(P)H-dependent flavin oxidoreductase YrpB (nitropropane dioxygenase family)
VGSHDKFDDRPAGARHRQPLDARNRTDVGRAAEFPLAAAALARLRTKAEAQGSADFSSLWAGQSASLGRPLPAGELTRMLAAEALERLRALGDTP